MTQEEREVKRVRFSPSTYEKSKSATPVPSGNPRFINASARFSLLKHPLNIKPSGNEIMLNEEKRNMKYDSTGPLFYHLPEEITLEIVNLLKDDVQNLINLSKTSRYFYAFIASLDDVWKSHQLSTGKELSKWQGSWRKSVLNIQPDHKTLSDVNWDFICSDLLYRPYQCSQINYPILFQHIITEEKLHHENINNEFVIDAKKYVHPADIPQTIVPLGRIPRVFEDSMDLSAFNEHSWHNYPFILQRNVSDKKEWPTNWNIEYLNSRFSDVLFRQEAVEWNLQLYSDYCKNNQDESPLYLFDCRSTAMKQLVKEYDVPDVFQQDLFTVFNVNNDENMNCRPDHAWIIMGPQRSGSTFHKDPNMTSAWNTTLTGSKLWVMLPPGLKPPGVMTDQTESEVTTPLGLAEWVLSGFYNDSVILSDTAVSQEDPKLRCLIGVTFPGECIHVPAGWWHTVINLEDSVALTQNFVPLAKLPHVLSFFKNKKDQISGFHTNQIVKVLKEIIKEDVRQSDNSENLSVFLDFLKNVNADELSDEDVGELNLNKLCLELPIFELFQTLLRFKGYEEELAQALKDMLRLDLKANGPTLKKNEKWEKLVESSNESTFSFGFNEESSSDEE